MIDVSDLIGVPYKEHGRTKEGFDCWGLVMEVARRVGVELPDYDYTLHSDNMTDKEAKKVLDAGRAKKIPVPVEGAIVLFENSMGLKHHVGIYVGDGMVCHCNKRGVHVDKYDRLLEEIEGVYIWQK